MIFRRILISFFILIVVLYPLQLCNAEENSKKVLLIYDARQYFGYVEDVVTSYRELLGHFDVDVFEQHQRDYRKGQLSGYDYVFIMGIEGDFSNSDLVNDLIKTEKTLCWIGRGIDKLLKDNENITFKYKGKSDNIVNISYKDKSFNIGRVDELAIVDGLSQNTEVYSWLSDGNKMYPYILRENNFWYVSKAEIYPTLFYIFSDVLYDIFDEHDIQSSKVFIRLEDVHPFRDTEKLRAIGEYLNSKNIPFMIAMIPAYKSPDSSYITTMSEKPEFVETMKYLQELGGSIILHGYTHQGFGGELSGEGYEFWDGINDSPLDLDMEKWIHERIGLGVQESVKNSIYPLAFEAPHYAICQKGYGILKNYFSTYCGHIQTSDQGFTTTSYPYNLYNTQLFNKLVPENLGYIDVNNPLAINEIENNMNRVSVVRGFTAGVFYHPYIDIKYLKEIVEFIEAQDIEFYDLKKENNWVKWEEISIISKDGEIKVDGLKDTENNPLLGKFQLGTKILIGLVLTINIMFLIIFINSKRKANKKLLGD
jgi:uncharacterized protein YdaL